MKIKILNYKNEVNWIELPENTYEIEVTVVTGDEIITAYDEDYNELCTWDSAELCKNPRTIPFLDGDIRFCVTRIVLLNLICTPMHIKD